MVNLLAINGVSKDAALKEHVARCGVGIVADEVCEVLGVLLSEDSHSFFNGRTIQPMRLLVLVRDFKPSAFNERNVLAIWCDLGADSTHAIHEVAPVVTAAFNGIAQQVFDVLLFDFFGHRYIHGRELRTFYN